MPAVDRTTPSVDDWADVFGRAPDIVPDKNRNRKLGRVHLPDVLLGHNQYITARVDGLITDATNSPFTTIILPYQYLEDPDRKLEWNGTLALHALLCRGAWRRSCTKRILRCSVFDMRLCGVQCGASTRVSPRACPESMRASRRARSPSRATPCARSRDHA